MDEARCNTNRGRGNVDERYVNDDALLVSVALRCVNVAEGRISVVSIADVDIKSNDSGNLNPVEYTT